VFAHRFRTWVEEASYQGLFDSDPSLYYCRLRRQIARKFRWVSLFAPTLWFGDSNQNKSGLSPANKMYDFQPVAGVEDCARPFFTRKNLMVELDGDPPWNHCKPLDKTRY